MEQNNMNTLPGGENGEKTFTQEEVNKIVSDRLKRESDKVTSTLDTREKDLKEREMRLNAREALSEKNLPLELLDVINYSDEESLQKSIDILTNCGIGDSRENKTQFRGFVPDESTFRVNSGGSHGAHIPLEDDSIKRAMGLK